MDNYFKKIDCLEGLKQLPDGIVDLIYLDPPFFTQRNQESFSRDRKKKFSFSDRWTSNADYVEFIRERLIECRRVLKDTGSIFYHCDKTASHIARFLLEEIFGSDRFRSEIIWHYKRWSNSKAGLLPNHQNIYWFSKTDRFKFNPVFNEYSPSTNIDQILQKRARDKSEKSVYATDENGDHIHSGKKNGVPLGDVWDIPFLNPKAKERTGYPTQKPILLLERIIEIASDENDIVLDPFFGSGTTLVSARISNRKYIGFDTSQDACMIASQRLETPLKTESKLLVNGRDSYRQADDELLRILKGIKLLPVQRNKSIDAIIPGEFPTGPMLVKIQREDETLSDAVYSLYKAAKKKGSRKSIVVKTHDDLISVNEDVPDEIEVVVSTGYLLQSIVGKV